MSNEPKNGDIWVHRKTGRRVQVRTSYGTGFVKYKALKSPNGTHTQETRKRRDAFLKEYELAPPAPFASPRPDPTVVRPPDLAGPAPWPQPLNTDTLSALAAAIRARAAKLPALAEREPWEQAMQAMYEIADALDSLSDGLSFGRATFLSMSVSKLLIHCRLAHTAEIAIRCIIDGEVYLDGVRVTEDAPITTVTRERFTVRCGERSAVVRVIG